MNKFKFYFILLITTVTIFSCSKDDDNDFTPEPLRDYQTQYNTEIANIEKYLNTYSITPNNNPGETNDQDVVFEKISSTNTKPSIMSYLNASTYPKLLIRNLTQNSVDYKIYYLILREGEKNTITGLGGVSPCNVDAVYTSYKGSYLYLPTATTTVTNPELSTTVFEESRLPKTYLSLFETITGWSEIFPQFKTGSYASVNGAISYSNFGAGVMFIPSGLAYYNTGSASIPAYVPLIFSFKLYDIQRLDQDDDGIPSYLEDKNNDGYVRILPTTDPNRYDDDTDKDGIPDFLDVDDDGDNYTTRLETQYIHPKDPRKIVRYYPFNATLINDPNKPDDDPDPTTPYVDESKGIPAYTPTGLDYKTPGRLRIHLDKDHH